jgi:CheY-like chemotaxis protein
MITTTKNVLVADSQSIDAAFLRLMLERNGYKADVVADGNEVMERLKSNKYAFVLINGNLRSSDGSSVARQIRANEQEGEHTIIVGITPTSLAKEARDFIQAGVDATLAKPVYNPQLNEVLSQFAGPWIDLGQAGEA